MGKTLRNILGTTLIVGAIFPTKIANAQNTELNGPTSLDVIGNPFSQPNITLQVGKQPLEWYGSGDGNLSGKVDSTDASLVENGVSNKMLDVNGDGLTNSEDAKTILDYVSGKIPYLPGHWNELKTKEERTNWAMKMNLITNQPSRAATPGWVCATNILDMCFRNGGLSNMDEFIQLEKDQGMQNVHSSEHNAWTNIPLYYFSTTNTNGVSHAIAGILVGEDPLKFDDWLFFNYHNFNSIKPGDFDMDANHSVTMGLEAYIKNPYTGKNYFDSRDNIITFNLTNGVATLSNYDKKYLTLNNPNIIKVHLGKLEKLLVDNNGLPEDQNYTPEFLKGKGYNAIPDTSKENTALPIKLEHIDGDTTRFSDNHYKFMRKFKGSIYSGGVIKTDSSDQEIEIDNLTSVGLVENLTPKDFRISQNFPNPFNPSTTIRYELPKYTSNFAVNIYDLQGKLVRALKGDRNAGVHDLKWDGRNEFNQFVGSGCYIYQFIADDQIKYGKMILKK